MVWRPVFRWPGKFPSERINEILGNFSKVCMKIVKNFVQCDLWKIKIYINIEAP